MKICPSCNFHFKEASWVCPSCGYEPKLINGYISFAPELAQINEGFDPQSFCNLFVLEERNFWFRARNKLILLMLSKYFPNVQNFLEIGCGTGFVMRAIENTFPNLECCASEIYVDGLKYASQRLSRTRLFQMDARNIPFAEEFDLVGIFDVLEHIQEDELALSEIYRSLKVGGGVIITVPQHPWLWSQDDVYAKHKRRYTRTELVVKLKRAGFRIARITSFVSLLLPLMFFSRLSKKHRSSNYDPVSELKLSSLLNSLLEKVLDIERFFIRYGISFPMGGSLLAIAYK